MTDDDDDDDDVFPLLFGMDKFINKDKMYSMLNDRKKRVKSLSSILIYIPFLIRVKKYPEIFFVSVVN